FTALDFEIIRLETAPAQGLESLSIVVNRFPGLRKPHSTDPCATSQFAGLALDVHDSRRHLPLRCTEIRCCRVLVARFMNGLQLVCLEKCRSPERLQIVCAV